MAEAARCLELRGLFRMHGVRAGVRAVGGGPFHGGRRAGDPGRARLSWPRALTPWTPPAPKYGYGRFDEVYTGLEFERLNNAVGPTGGQILMKNGKKPKSVAIIHCVGSRDVNYHVYCSRVCCMYALKYGHLIKEKAGHNTEVHNFYIDMRCFGKGYEEFYRRLQEEGINFVRGKPATDHRGNTRIQVRSN